MLILTHVWSRITCRWTWEWLTPAAWGAMAHWKGVLVGACVAVGGVGWWTVPGLPAWPAAPPGVASGYIPPPYETTPTDVPEPSSMALLLVGITVTLAVRRSSKDRTHSQI
jgi:hypothetical protein